jgi:hypothetical protein
MRPLTAILLIIVLGCILFFGFSIYRGKKGANVTPATVKTSINTDGNKQNFKLKVNSKSIWMNGKESIMDSPVREINGRTMVPLKFLLDFLKAQNVNYDAKTEEVTFDLEIPTNNVTETTTKQIQTSNPTQMTQTTPIEDSLLTKEARDKISSTASMSATFFKIESLQSDGFTIIIKINLMMEPKTIEDVKKITDTFTNDVSYIFDTKHDIKVIATRKEPGKEIYKTYGTSRFQASTGKIEFTEEVKK